VDRAAEGDRAPPAQADVGARGAAVPARRRRDHGLDQREE